MTLFIAWCVGIAVISWLDVKFGPKYGEIFFLWGFWTLVIGVIALVHHFIK